MSNSKDENTKGPDLTNIENPMPFNLTNFEKIHIQENQNQGP